MNPQISPQLLGQIRPQIWWFPKFVLKFGGNCSPQFGESPRLSPNLGNPQICPQISGQIRPQICPQKAREHTSEMTERRLDAKKEWQNGKVIEKYRELMLWVLHR